MATNVLETKSIIPFSNDVVGAMIKTQRIKLGLSQSKLADKLGLNQKHISLYELGKRTVQNYTSMALALEQSADFFYMPEKKSDLHDQSLSGVQAIEVTKEHSSVSASVLNASEEVDSTENVVDAPTALETTVAEVVPSVEPIGTEPTVDPSDVAKRSLKGFLEARTALRKRALGPPKNRVAVISPENTEPPTDVQAATPNTVMEAVAETEAVTEAVTESEETKKVLTVHKEVCEPDGSWVPEHQSKDLNKHLDSSSTASPSATLLQSLHKSFKEKVKARERPYAALEDHPIYRKLLDSIGPRQSVEVYKNKDSMSESQGLDWKLVNAIKSNHTFNYGDSLRFQHFNAAAELHNLIELWISEATKDPRSEASVRYELEILAAPLCEWGSAEYSPIASTLIRRLANNGLKTRIVGSFPFTWIVSWKPWD